MSHVSSRARAHLWHADNDLAMLLGNRRPQRPAIRHALVYVTWLVRVCDMTRSCMWHDSSTCQIRLAHMWPFDNVLATLLVAFMCVTWLIYIWDCESQHDNYKQNLESQYDIYVICHQSCASKMFPKTQSGNASKSIYNVYLIHMPYIYIIYIYIYIHIWLLRNYVSKQLQAPVT